MPKARPKTGEKRETNQPLKIDRLPVKTPDAILILRNQLGKTWDEIESLSAEPVGQGKPGFVEWDKLDPEILALFPHRRIPRSTLHRWYDIRISQVREDVLQRSAQARVVAEAFAKSLVKDADEGVLNAARDTIMNVLAEDGSAGGRKAAARQLISLAEVMQTARANTIKERKVATEERKIKLLEERERLQREKLQQQAADLERKRSSGELKPEDIAKLVEVTFGIAPKAA